MPFKLKVNFVGRDQIQSWYGNGYGFNHPTMKKIARTWYELHQLSNELIEYDEFETGGADPQVTARNRGDFMEFYRSLREELPRLKIRPLWRAENGFLLKPSHTDDLEHLLTQQAEDLADTEFSLEEVPELYRVKTFNSQGTDTKVVHTIEFIKKLRDNKHPITAEIAIPYSGDEVYPDALYVQKIIESARVFQNAKLPMELCHISLKDMAGELTSERAKVLLPKIIKALKSVGSPPFGLHLHNTGLAAAAYASAIEIFKDKEHDYPLGIDIVECDQYDPSFINEESWRNSGFASLLEIDAILKDRGISLGITQEHTKKLKQIGADVLQVSKANHLKRTASDLNGPQLGFYHVAGGAFSSFSIAVSQMGKGKGLENILGISKPQALQFAGSALNAVGKWMGYTFGVTPGFQNKQYAALNMLQNMIDAGIITREMSLVDMIKVVGKKLSNEDIALYFFPNLDQAVKDFLMNEMPVETIARMAKRLKEGGMKEVDVIALLGEPREVHPAITATLKRHEAEPKKYPSRLPAITATVDAVLAEGLIRATHTQTALILKKAGIEKETALALMKLLDAQKIIYNEPDGIAAPWLDKSLGVIHRFFLTHGDDNEIAKQKAKKIVAELERKARQTNITWGLQIDKSLREIVEKPWLREPNAEHYTDRMLYDRALEKFQSGKNPNPDFYEMIFQKLRENKLKLPMVYQMVELAKGLEFTLIRISVLEFIQKNAHHLSLEKAVEHIYHEQKKIIRDKAYKGEQFLFSEETRVNMALECLKACVNNPEQVDAAQQKMENTVVTSAMPGVLTKLFPKTSVKKGDDIAIITYMKMEFFVKAHSDGEISFNVKEGDSINNKAIIASYKALEIEETSKTTFAQVIHIATDETLAKFKKQADDQARNVAARQTQIQTVLDNPPPAHAEDNTLMGRLKKSGYYAPELSLTPFAKEGHENEIHVIGNRSVAADKTYGELKQAGYSLRIFYTAGEETTPVIAHAEPGETILIESYTEFNIILGALEKLAIDNPGKTIYLHPGWGFLSENDAFVEALQKLGEKYKVVFVGPPAHAMGLVGDKLNFRKMVKQLIAEGKIDPEFGLDFFEANIDPSAGYEQDYTAVEKMGGDVVLKAVAGGGGRGIEFFKINPGISRDENFRIYKQTLERNVEFSKNLFHDGRIVVEQRIGIAGQTNNHMEVQFAIAKDAELINIRNCTPQNLRQKTDENNVIKGDYPEAITHKVILASRAITRRLAELGYQCLGTIEFLVMADGTVKPLEVNTRPQVEHPVSERDMAVKINKNISLLLLNLLCKQYPNKTIHQILFDHFGVTPAELTKTLMPGDKRIIHIRGNSRKIDYKTGSSTPSCFFDDMWPGHVAIDEIVTSKGILAITGGIGRSAKYDPHTTTLCGEREAVLEVMREYIKWMEVAQACYRHDGTLSLPFVLEFDKVLYDAKGNFKRTEISTDTIDKLLEAVQRGDIKFQLKPQGPTMTRQLDDNAMQEAVAQLQALNRPTQAATVAMTVK